MRQLQGFLILGFAVLAATAAGAATNYVDLGTAAPPATVGGVPVTAFDEAAQAAIPDGTFVTLIPGSPVPGDLITDLAVDKRTVGVSWGSWSHGYMGPVFFLPGGEVLGPANTNVVGGGAEGGAGTTLILTFPAGSTAVYVFVEPNVFDLFDVTVTTDSGATSGPVMVDGSGGATGFGFYTDAGEVITTLTIDVDVAASGFAIGEFGVSTTPVPVELQTFYVD